MNFLSIYSFLLSSHFGSLAEELVVGALKLFVAICHLGKACPVSITKQVIFLTSTGGGVKPVITKLRNLFSDILRHSKNDRPGDDGTLRSV